MITEGDYTATIQENDLRATVGGTNFVHLMVEVEEEGRIAIQIWLTENASNMARAQLKVCGFDVDGESLEVLLDNKTHLKGKEIPISVELDEYKGKETLKARVRTMGKVAKKQIKVLDKLLQKKKGSASDVEEDDIPF